MPDALHTSLQDQFGFLSFRSGQEDAIRSLVNGQHTLVVMPTGSGKSLVFQLAGLQYPGITLVISPLIALMKDQVDSLVRHRLPATYINSTLSPEEQGIRLRNLAEGNYRIVYVAPERLRSAIFLEAVQKQTVSLLAVDEAHCISEWGHDFRPDYLNIAGFRSALGNPLTVALTATATTRVQAEIEKLLGLSNVRRVVTGFNRPNLELDVRYVQDLPARLSALRSLMTDYPSGGVIIYTGTRRDAEEAAEFVTSVVGIPAQHYHAGLLADERSRIQDAFMTGDLSTVAATNAFGMGIDRADGRQVIHYAMPGTLEAYYQEAGRAGRDGLPARTVLLYSPNDVALQEWFIENSKVSETDLRSLFEALRPASAQRRAITADEISLLTSLPEVKIRLGLAELERAGMLQRLGDEGMRMHLRLNEWKPAEISGINRRIERHQTHRKSQLNSLREYAESNACRRQIIMRHFNDSSAPEAEICCDNCQSRKAAQKQATDRSPATKPLDTLTQAERAALIVLDTVRRMPRPVGCEKITQVLKGSKAKGIQQFGYDRHVYYARMAALPTKEIKAILDQLLEQKYLKVVGGKYPVVVLTPQGETALSDKLAIPIKGVRKISKQDVARKEAVRKAGSTLDLTAQLFAKGSSVQQIASQRGLSPSTIYSHAAQLIAAGRMSLEQVVPLDTASQIQTAIDQVGSLDRLAPIKALLPEDIDYNFIRCVVESRRRELQSQVGKTQSQTTDSPRLAGSSPDTVQEFLARPHPRRLLGPWSCGWALGDHSQFSGADWSRQEVGELTYRLKYLGDLTVIPALLERVTRLLLAHPELGRVDGLVPVPPSTARQNDPVSSFSLALAEKIGLPCLPILAKSRPTDPQKEMHTLAQKKANVAGAFALQSAVKGMRLMVIDDLFDSGATLEEIFHLLKKAGAASVCILTLTRTIHVDG